MALYNRLHNSTPKSKPDRENSFEFVNGNEEAKENHLSQFTNFKYPKYLEDEPKDNN